MQTPPDPCFVVDLTISSRVTPAHGAPLPREDFLALMWDLLDGTGLLGIHEGLGRLFRQTPAVADTWVTRANSDAPFHWRTPIRFMREGGLPAMATVCTYVNEWTGGGLVRESLRRSMT